MFSETIGWVAPLEANLHTSDGGGQVCVALNRIILCWHVVQDILFANLGQEFGRIPSISGFHAALCWPALIRARSIDCRGNERGGGCSTGVSALTARRSRPCYRSVSASSCRTSGRSHFRMHSCAVLVDPLARGSGSGFRNGNRSICESGLTVSLPLLMLKPHSSGMAKSTLVSVTAYSRYSNVCIRVPLSTWGAADKNSDVADRTMRPSR